MKKDYDVESNDIKKTDKKKNIKKVALVTGAVAMTAICGTIGIAQLQWKKYWEIVRPDEIS